MRPLTVKYAAGVAIYAEPESKRLLPLFHFLVSDIGRRSPVMWAKRPADLERIVAFVRNLHTDTREKVAVVVHPAMLDDAVRMFRDNNVRVLEVGDTHTLFKAKVGDKIYTHITASRDTNYTIRAKSYFVIRREDMEAFARGVLDDTEDNAECDDDDEDDGVEDWKDAEGW